MCYVAMRTHMHQNAFLSISHGLGLVLGFYRSQKVSKVAEIQAFKVSEKLLFTSLYSCYANKLTLRLFYLEVMVWYGKSCREGVRLG